MKLTKFGKFLVKAFDMENPMSTSDESLMRVANANLFMDYGITLKDLEKMSIKDMEKLEKLKKRKKV